MADWTYFESWTEREAEVIARGATPPDPTKFRVALYSGITITNTMTLADLAGFELIGDGYARQAYAPEQGAYDAVQKRYELPTVTMYFTAAETGSLQWTGAVMIADEGGLNEAPVFFVNLPPQLIGAGTSRPVQVDWAFFNAGNVDGV